jgi:hypothetical protein
MAENLHRSHPIEKGDRTLRRMHGNKPAEVAAKNIISHTWETIVPDDKHPGSNEPTPFSP